jgi:hypothetical protein
MASRKSGTSGIYFRRPEERFWAGGGSSILGDVLGESKGKRIVRRVLSSGPLKVEVSFEDTGTMLGVATNGTGTYTSEARPDGSLYGEGQGVMITADGEPITWRGSGARQDPSRWSCQLPRHTVTPHAFPEVVASE